MTTTIEEPVTKPTMAHGRTDSIADLLLARLLVPAKTPPTPKKVRGDVSKLFDTPLSEEEFNNAVSSLKDQEFLTVKPLRLTATGQERALANLGVEKLPARCPWQSILAKFLVPRILKIAPTATDKLKKISEASQLAALLLKQKLDLKVGVGATLNNVLESLACRELGFPELHRLSDIKNAVLSRLIHSERTLNAKQLKVQAPRVLLDAKKSGIDGLRLTLIRAWLQSADEKNNTDPAEVTESLQHITEQGFDLEAFSRTVKAIARDCPTGRYGENRVFINHVWRHLIREAPFHSLDMATFKRHLLEATIANLIKLTRADLVQVMNPDDVRESTTIRENAEYHFVLIEKELS